MINKIRKFIIFSLLLVVANFSLAAYAASPVEVMDQTANQMLSELAKNKARLKTSDTLIYSIVQRTLMPHIDLNRMAGSVVGREHWSSATNAQHQTFIREFTKLVISTYANALASYDDDQVKFHPSRVDAGVSTVVVNSVIIRKNGQKIPISYNLVRVDGTWKIYDFNIENISMVQSYRSQFSDILSTSGMNGLMQKLISHNHTWVKQ